MLSTQQAVLRRFWYAVMPLSHLKDGPQPFTLLGEKIVLFLDDQGQPAALKDRCCHRTAQLSKGWCDGGHITCGYHGWTYDRTGAVVRIPQYEAERAIPCQFKTTAYHCQARYGYAWVALDDPIDPIPDVPEFDDPQFRCIFQFYETWATSGLRFMENSFDNSHFSFVHRNTFGVAASPKPSSYELKETPTGFYAETVIEALNPPAFHRVSGLTDAQTTRHMRNEWYRPFARRLDIEYPSGIRHIIINSLAPIDDGHIQVAQWLFRNDTEADCPAQLLIDFDHEITREDKVIIESTDPDAMVDTARRSEFSMPSDKPGMVMRQQLLALLRAHGEEERHLGPATATSGDAA
jgi:phenylpropionate dioxygenase-like ring-hydroxylating dioxygenase large terminal subunit